MNHKPAEAAICITLRLPIAALVGLVFFGEWPVIWVWVGGVIIVASSFLLTQRETCDDAVNKTPPQMP